MVNKDSKNSFSNLPSCAADYIKLIIKKMRWQKKTRKDVEAELIAHFEDALKDCKTEGEKQTTAEKLITEFGDAKLIATLARRAKKRCRPLWQKTLIGAFQVIGIIIVLFILYVSWFISGRPKITFNYVAELNRIVKPSDSNESQNATFYYSKAAKGIEPFPENLKNIFGKSYYECNEPEKRQGQDWLAKNQQVLNLVATGSEKPYCWDKYESKNNDMMSVLLPHLKEYKDIARILCWKACFSASEGNYRQGFEDIITTYKLGKHIKTEPILIEQLVGIAIENLSAQNLRQILIRYNIDALELRKVQDELSTITQNETFRMNFKAEKFCMYDAIQQLFTDDIFGGHIYLKEFWKLMSEIIGANGTQKQGFWVSSKSLFQALFIQPGKKETLKSANEIYDDYYGKLSALTLFEQRSMATNMHKKLQELASKNMFLTILYPGFDKISGLAYVNKAEIQATTAIIAIIRYKQENGGTYPDKLEQLLDKGLLKEIPLDPYSDKPLVYKKTENGFTLYSVGDDFVDNGGKACKKQAGRSSIWPSDSNDSDAVLWPIVHSTNKK